MPRSMTGFGQADIQGYHVEIKGVNHRFKDIRVKLPRDLSALEIQVRDAVSRNINRGKVDVTVTRTPSLDTKEGLSVNWNLAQACYEDLLKMAGTFGGEVTFRDILLVPGVLAEKTTQVEEHWLILEEAVKEALDAFTRARENEGNNLKADIQSRVKTLLGMKDTMKALATDMTNVYKERLHANLNALLSDKPSVIDDVRLEQEVALLADRSDITEELVRLESHIRSLEDTMNLQTGPIGRHTDFILQEVSREVNTIGSKSQITDISRLVIDAKTEIEKIREQVQNIE